MSECARLSDEVEEMKRHYKERIQTLEQQVCATSSSLYTYIYIYIYIYTTVQKFGVT